MNDSSLIRTTRDGAVTTGTTTGTTASTTTSAVANARPRSRKRSSWIYTLSGVCFIFGGLLAMQLRAIDRVRQDRVKADAGVVQAKAASDKAQKELAAETRRREEMEGRIRNLTATLATKGTLSKTEIAKLNAQIKEMQALAGFAEVNGPGIRMIMDDNATAAQAAQGAASPFLPGIVHDFDLLQVVNELRGAKAEAISVNGRRITAYTPIRCVGPTILINFEAATPPFRIEAIGDQETLENALNLPGGIVDNLRNPAAGPGLRIKINRVDDMKLPASENQPRLQAAKTP